MPACRTLLALGLGIALAPLLVLGDEPKDKPITTAKGELGDLLRKWWQEGTAAGNVGDWYDNRDGAHSDLNVSPYPQLQKVIYTPEDIKLRRHWAAQTITRPEVTFGNSSTSAPPQFGGSNPRHYYTSTQGLSFLHHHYTHNNVYIYPEHRDHDPGRNGKNDGYGDLYPTNTPYLIVSQGSSGSDQPFMRAIPFTLAAFRPEVKKKLVESGLLMPTLQMIFRSTNKHLKDPKEYLTGKAHPTVFEGAWVNDLKMAQLAHEITLQDIPPMVQLKVVKEEETVLGRDFFERGGSEKLCDTPAVIARIWRGKDGSRRLTVSAEGSHDVNKKPLTFEWVVLRGDAERIQIKPQNEARSVAEIVVPYHERRPVEPGSKMDSNRVDIGVFVHNGARYSAPGFITFFTLDSEARTYDKDGRVLEIGYGLGETNLTVTDWQGYFKTAGADSPAARLLKFSEAERAVFRQATEDHAKLQEAVTAAQEKRKSADAIRQKAAKEAEAAESKRAAAQKAHQENASDASKIALEKATAEAMAALEARKKAEAEVQAAQKGIDAAGKAVNDFLDRKRDDAPLSLRGLAERAFQAVLQDVAFCNENAAVLDELKKTPRIEGRPNIGLTRQLLLGLGMAKEAGDRLQFQPIRAGTEPLSQRLTPYEKSTIARHNGALLGGLVLQGIVTSTYPVHYVDHRLTAPRTWRDVYRYDAKGNALGWTRHDGARSTEFNADGLMVLEKDVRGRCLKARTVKYEQDAPTRLGDWKPLKQTPGDELVTYEYDGDEDAKGRIKSRE